MIKANDPSLTSWIPVREDSDFPIQNLPFGVGSTGGQRIFCCSIIGDTVIDLVGLQDSGLLEGSRLPAGVFAKNTLNDFIALGRRKVREVRNRLSELFCADNHELQDRKALCEQILIPVERVQMLMPLDVPDYTDFYSSMEHATNVGKMFRNPENALLPNWKHLPVGYHGRASSIVVSGTDIHRPKGQYKPDDGPPRFGPTRLLDMELEMAFVTCTNTVFGQSVAVEEAEEHIFGLLLFNDWSARDIQKWEYVPLGPFLGKNFASSISPWIVTLDALEPFRVEGPVQDPPVLPYLAFSGRRNFNIELEAYLQVPDKEPVRITKTNFRYMYWNMAQQLAHHTVNGCNIRVGDLYASGTISGPEPDSWGSLLELTWKGTRPLKMPDGSERRFLEDGDTLILKGYAPGQGYRIGFGEVKTTILPPNE